MTANHVIAESLERPLLSLEELGRMVDPLWDRRRGSVHDRCIQAILDRDDDTDVELLAILAAEDWKSGAKLV